MRDKLVLLIYKHFIFTMFKTNEGFLDRSLRVTVGAVFISSAHLIMSPSFQTAVYVIGCAMTVTGLIGFCGLYTLLKINTCPVGSQTKLSDTIKLLMIFGFTLLLSGVIISQFTQKTEQPTSTPRAESQNLTTPDRQAELNGYVLSIEGNEIMIANEIGVKEITDEERARRQKMTPEERQVLRARESANVTKENVTITIPVGTPIVKGAGNASGQTVSAEMSEMVKGVYVSIWKTSNTVEMVKLKGVSR